MFDAIHKKIGVTKELRDHLSKTSLLLPTRGRKEHLERLFESLLKQTSDLSKIEIVLCIDEDDIETQSLVFDPVFHVTRLMGPRSTMETYNTRCFVASSGDIVILFNDDIVVRTPNWDRIILSFDEGHKDKIYLAYVNDLLKEGESWFFSDPVEKSLRDIGRSFSGGV